MPSKLFIDVLAEVFTDFSTTVSMMVLIDSSRAIPSAEAGSDLSGGGAPGRKGGTDLCMRRV